MTATTPGALPAISRRGFLWGAAAVAATATGVGVLYQPPQVVVERHTVHLARLPAEFDGFRIVHLTDLHVGPFTPEALVHRAVEAANSLQPDLALFTGDYVTLPMLTKGAQQTVRQAGLCAEALARVRSRLGCWAVFGNHDAWTDLEAVASALRDRRIPALRNQAAPVEHKGARLWIAGVESVSAGAAKIWIALEGRPAADATILLAHEPDFADEAAQYNVDLQLSGHSHGGQVRVPGMRPLLLPPLGRKYPAGFYRVGRLMLYTSRGVGMIQLPFRFNCPPEVTLFTLRSGDGAPSQV